MIFTQQRSPHIHALLLVASVVLVVAGIFWLVAFPKMRQIYKHGRETSALNALQAIYRAQVKFQAARNRFATLKELAAEGLIASEYANGATINGYIFSASDITAKTFTIHADRSNVSNAYRDFNILETGMIYGVENQTATTVLRG